MSVVAAAIVGSAVVGGVSTYLSSKEQSKAIRQGADAETQLGYENLDFQKEQAAQQREDFAPWRNIGQDALDKIWAGVKSGAFIPGNIDVTKDPGYQFRLDQGVKGLDQSAAARGRLQSGAQSKAITDYAQNYASNEYANAYARDAQAKATKYNILSNLSTTGQAAAAGQAASSAQLATNAGNIYANMGTAQNEAIQAEGQVNASAYSDYGQILQALASNWLTYSGTKQ